jgi:hypothetical protein
VEQAAGSAAVPAEGSAAVPAEGSAVALVEGSVVEQGAVQELVLAQAQVSGLKPARELKWVVM